MRLLQLLFALRQVGLGVPNRSMCGGCFWLIYLAVGLTEGLVDVILYHQPDDKKKNRGFCFLEYEDHKSAAQARRRLMSGKVKVWGNVVTVEWADPVEEPDPEVMAKVNAVSCVGRCGSHLLSVLSQWQLDLWLAI